MEPLSPDPLLSCVLGDLSSGSGHSSSMQDSQHSSLCRAVHCVPTPAVPQTSNTSAVDLTQSRSAAVVMASDNCSNGDLSCVYQQVSPPSDPVQEQRSDGDPIVHASTAEIPVHFPSASIVAIVQGWPISGAETLQAIYGGMVPTELSLRELSLRDADLIRRTARSSLVIAVPGITEDPRVIVGSTICGGGDRVRSRVRQLRNIGLIYVVVENIQSESKQASEQCD